MHFLGFLESSLKMIPKTSVLMEPLLAALGKMGRKEIKFSSNGTGWRGRVSLYRGESGEVSDK